MNHNKLWKSLKEMGIAGYLTCLLRNLVVGQEVNIRTLYGTTDCFNTETRMTGLSTITLFNLYAEHNLRKTELDELPVGIKISGKKSRTSGMLMISL